MEGSRRRSSYPGGSRPLGAGRPGDAGRRPVRAGSSSGRRNGGNPRRRRRKRLMKRILTAAFCLILTGGIAFGVSRLAGSFHFSKKKKLRAQGIELLRGGDAGGAVSAFDEALAAAGDKSKTFNIDVLSYRAEAEMMLDDFEAAKHSWDLILEQGGDPISGRYMKSFCESRLGNKDQAVALYREALGMEEKGKTSPGYEQALLASGEACMEAGDHEGAKVLYEEALRTTGGDGRFESRVRCQMGLYQMAEEDYEGAVDSFYQGYDRLITSYKAGTGASLDQAAAAITEENQADWQLLKKLAFYQAAVCEYMQNYEEAKSRFETYIQVFGPDEAAQHEIDFLNTRIR